MPPECNYNPKLGRKIEIVDTLLAMVIVGLSIISILSYSFFKEQFSLEILLYGKLGLFLASAFFEFVPQVLNPFLVVLIGMSSGMSAFQSVLFVSLGSIFASIFGYELGRRYGWRFLCPLFKIKTQEKLFKYMKKYGKWVVLVGALTPAPYVPLFFGALNVSRKEFILFGIIPRVLSFVVTGYLYHFGIVGYNL